MTHVWLVYDIDPYEYHGKQLAGVFDSQSAAEQYIDQRFAESQGTLERDEYWRIEIRRVNKG